MKALLSYSNFTSEQRDAIDRLYENDATLLIASKGFGKAAISQTAAQEMIRDGHLTRVLVIAPPKVARLTWGEEYRKWRHLERPGLALGDAAERAAVLQNPEYRIVVVSADNLKAVMAQVDACGHGFDGLVIDEISRFKSVGGVHYKALRPRIKRFKWRCGLSATPVAESGTDIYGQALLLDEGRALGRNKDRFLRRFYVSDYSGYNWELQFGAEQRLAAALADLVWVAPDTDYQGSLPELHEEIVEFDLPAEAEAAYEEMAQTMYLEAADVEAVNAAVLAGKLQQVASGFVYREDGKVVRLHSAKFNALTALLLRVGWPRTRVVIMYQFIEELRVLRDMFPRAAVLADSPARSMAAWNAGELDTLLIHPRSAAHGINLQAGGCTLVCLAPCWSADQWDQVIGRLWRRGQQDEVTRYTLVANGTVDRAILLKLADKKSGEKALMNHLADVSSRR